MMKMMLIHVSVNNYDTQDPDIQIIADKFKTGCKCKQGNCLGSFH